MKNRQTGHKQRNSLSDPEINIHRNSDFINPCNTEDTSLSDRRSEYKKARTDLEDVKSDPALSSTREMVKDMILDFHKKGIRNKANEKYIKENTREEVRNNGLQEEIDKIKLEIKKNNINEITSDWVQDWEGRKEGDGSADPKRDEIRDYVIHSVIEEAREPEIRIAGKQKNAVRKYLMNYISLSAAAVIGIFILIKTLIPSYTPEKLFNSYYGPMNVVRPVTRSNSTDGSDNLASGIDSYKNEDYQHAEIAFSKALVKNETSVESGFFLGITYLQLGNYGEAINLLTNVTSQPGGYKKDAEWYLGLAYLKTGETDKALTCFGSLAKTQGFYRERAEKILRHLK